MRSMRPTRVAQVIARCPQTCATLVAGAASAVILLLARRRHAAWLENVEALGCPRRGGILGHAAPHYHHVLLQYESLALLGGRRFPVEVRGEDHLMTAVRARRGIVVATAHVGNWMLGAVHVHQRTGLPIHSVAGTQMFRSWTADLRLGLRRQGVRIHPRRTAPRQLLRALRRGEIVALHLDGDQHVRPGPATRGIELLARRAGAPILPIVAERRAGGAMAILIDRPIELSGPRAAPEELKHLLFALVRERHEQWTLFRPLEGEE